MEENIRIIENELELLEKEKVELMELIDSFSGADNQIVKLKYIDDMDVYDIADETVTAYLIYESGILRFERHCHLLMSMRHGERTLEEARRN